MSRSADSPVPPRPARRFVLLCAGLWLFFALIAWLTPIVLDDWFEVVFIKQHGLSLGSIWDYASYNYLNYNPRIGETFLLIVNGPRWLHVLITPTVELFLLFVVFALAFGRWPRAHADDVPRLLCAQALLFLAVPWAGLLYFYRPYTTNYLFGSCLQLALFVPFRFALAAPGPRPAAWVPLMFLLGVAAGMTNEHTGPTAMVVVALLVWLAARRRELRAWMVTGAAGLWIGYLLLFFAPGQTKRYGGAAAKVSPIATVLERGAEGVVEVYRSYLWEVQLALLVVLVGTALAAISASRRGARPAAPDRRTLGVIAVACGAATTILATLLASPLVGERLYLAPALLFVVAVLPLLDLALAEPPARRFLVGVLGLSLVYFVGRVTVEYTWAHVLFSERMAVLEAAPPGSVAHVEPYRRWNTTRLSWGDDLRTFTHRQYVAHEYFGLAGIEYSKPVRWAEPTPPYTLDYQLTYEPPLSEAEWRRAADVPTYTATYVEWVIAKLRRHLPALTAIPGHRLARVDVYVRGLELPELRGRPLRWLTWQDGRYAYPEGGVLVDARQMPYFIVKRPNVPPGLEEAYVHACGETMPVALTPHAKGIALPWQPWCQGTQLAIACDDATCWLAGATWR